MHLLALADPVDDTHRRLMNRQLTVQESRHRLARAICLGGRGQLCQAYREGEDPHRPGSEAGTRACARSDAEVKEWIAADSEGGGLTAHRDDGLYRLQEVEPPKSSAYWVEVMTRPARIGGLSVRCRRLVGGVRHLSRDPAGCPSGRRATGKESP